MELITAMLDSKSKRREDHGYYKPQNNGQRMKDRARMAELDRRLEGTALGYNRKGQVCVSHGMQREYE